MFKQIPRSSTRAAGSTHPSEVTLVNLHTLSVITLTLTCALITLPVPMVSEGLCLGGIRNLGFLQRVKSYSHHISGQMNLPALHILQ